MIYNNALIFKLRINFENIQCLIYKKGSAHFSVINEQDETKQHMQCYLAYIFL